MAQGEFYVQVDENGVRAQLQPTHQFDSIAERCSRTSALWDSRTSAPGLAHICAGTRAHLRRDSPTSAPGLVRTRRGRPLRSEAPSRDSGVRAYSGVCGGWGCCRFKRDLTTDMDVFINKPPKWNDQLGAYCLNFNGRRVEPPAHCSPCH
jgi:hypothetical protein